MRKYAVKRREISSKRKGRSESPARCSESNTPESIVIKADEIGAYMVAPDKKRETKRRSTPKKPPFFSMGGVISPKKA